MSISLPSTSATGAPEVPADVRAAGLEELIAHLVAKQASGRIGYWAAFSDERGVSHYSLTTNPAFAELSAENADNRMAAIEALNGAIERYKANLVRVRPDRRRDADRLRGEHRP
jgi:hypothetical protein